MYIYIYIYVLQSPQSVEWWPLLWCLLLMNKESWWALLWVKLVCYYMLMNSSPCHCTYIVPIYIYINIYIYIYIYYRNYKKLKFSRDGDPYYFSRNFHNIETIWFYLFKGARDLNCFSFMWFSSFLTTLHME